MIKLAICYTVIPVLRVIATVFISAQIGNQSRVLHDSAADIR